MNKIINLLLLSLLVSCQQATAQWIKSSAKKQNIDENILIDVVGQLESLEESFSFVLIRNGFLISEHYFHGQSQDDLHDIRSATKTIVSTLIGVAIQNQFINSVDDKVIEYLPELKSVSGDSTINTITIEHLMNMASGIEWNEHKGDLLAWMNKTSPTSYLLSKDFVKEPGLQFNYNSATVHLLNLIIEASSEMTVMEFSNTYLFEPLGIKRIEWPKLKDGRPNGGFGIRIHPLDLAKIGQLFLNKGIWGNKRILSQDWIEAVMNPQMDLKKKFGALNDSKYGYLWWSGQYKSHKVYFALGYAGQFLAIIPSLKIIVCVTQNWALSKTSTQREDFVTELIVRLIEGSQ